MALDELDTFLQSGNDSVGTDFSYAPDELDSFLAPEPEPEPVVEPETDGFGKDLLMAWGKGSNSLLEGIGTIYGLATGDMDNWAREAGSRGQEYYREGESETLKKLEADRSAAVAEADGFLDEAGTAFWHTIKSGRLLTSLMVQTLPHLVAGGGAGRAAGGGAKMLAASEKVVEKVAVGATIGTMGAIQGADVAGQHYEEMLLFPQSMWDKNSEYMALAEKIGADAAKEQISHKSAVDVFAISMGISIISQVIVPNGAVLEKVLAGKRSGILGGRFARTMKGGFGEMVQEVTEEGGGQITSNIFKQEIDPSIETMEGVGETVGIAAPVGFLFGAPAGLASAAPDPPPKVSSTDTRIKSPPGKKPPPGAGPIAGEVQSLEENEDAITVALDQSADWAAQAKADAMQGQVDEEETVLLEEAVTEDVAQEKTFPTFHSAEVARRKLPRTELEVVMDRDGSYILSEPAAADVLRTLAEEDPLWGTYPPKEESGKKPVKAAKISGKKPKKAEKVKKPTELQAAEEKVKKLNKFMSSPAYQQAIEEAEDSEAFEAQYDKALTEAEEVLKTEELQWAESEPTEAKDIVREKPKQKPDEDSKPEPKKGGEAWEPVEDLDAKLADVDKALEKLPKNFDMMTADPDEVGKVQELVKEKRELTDQIDEQMNLQDVNALRLNLMQQLHKKKITVPKGATLKVLRELAGVKKTKKTPAQVEKRLKGKLEKMSHKQLKDIARQAKILQTGDREILTARMLTAREVVEKVGRVYKSEDEIMEAAANGDISAEDLYRYVEAIKRAGKKFNRLGTQVNAGEVFNFLYRTMSKSERPRAITAEESEEREKKKLAENAAGNEENFPKRDEIEPQVIDALSQLKDNLDRTDFESIDPILTELTIEAINTRLEDLADIGYDYDMLVGERVTTLPKYLEEPVEHIKNILNEASQLGYYLDAFYAGDKSIKISNIPKYASALDTVLNHDVLLFETHQDLKAHIKEHHFEVWEALEAELRILGEEGDDDADEKGADPGKLPSEWLTYKKLPREVTAFAADLISQTEPHPKIDEARFFAEEQVLVQIIPAGEKSKGVHIDVIEAVRRGEGAGSKVLRKLLALADKHGVYITLYPIASSDGDFTQDQLIAWYEREGFEYRAEYDDMLTYRPNPKKKGTDIEEVSPSILGRFATEVLPDGTVYELSKSAETQIATTVPTYDKAKAQYFADIDNGDILDYGAGKGLASKKHGFESLEPYPRGWTPQYQHTEQIKRKYDGIIANNILNVLPKHARRAVLFDMAEKLNPGGKIFINVRGKDVFKAKIKTRVSATEIITSRGTYQKAFTPSELKKFILDELGPDYTVEKSDLGTISVIVTKKGDKATDEITPAEVKAATEKVEPTGEAIAAAEEYRAERPELAGLILSFKPGDKRNGEEMLHYYGEIAGTEDADGMPIDVMLNKDYDTGYETSLFIINQDDGAGKFLQHKVMAGFKHASDAEVAYMEHWGEESMMEAPHELLDTEFQEWLDTGNHKIEYVEKVTSQKVTKPKPAQPVTLEKARLHLDGRMVTKQGLIDEMAKRFNIADPVSKDKWTATELMDLFNDHAAKETKAEGADWVDEVKSNPKDYTEVDPETGRLMALAGVIDKEAMLTIAGQTLREEDIQAQLQEIIDGKGPETQTSSSQKPTAETRKKDARLAARAAKKAEGKFPDPDNYENIEEYPWEDLIDEDIEILLPETHGEGYDISPRTYVIDVYSDRERQKFVKRVYAANFDQYRKVDKAYREEHGGDVFIQITRTGGNSTDLDLVHIITGDETTEPYRTLTPIQETKDSMSSYKKAKTSKGQRGKLLQEMGFLNKSEWAQIASEYQHLLMQPPEDEVFKFWGEEFKKGKTKRNYISHAEGKKIISQWKAHARAQSGNGSKIILSLFDFTGEWAQPWIDAGYDVRAIDMKRDGVDIMDIDYEWLLDTGFLDGEGFWGILAACPCQKFTNTTAQDRLPVTKTGKSPRPAMEGGTDFIGQTHSAVDLVDSTLSLIEFLKPRWFALENPLGRIQEITDAPDGRLSFNPNNFGDPYTKKTVLHGHFNANLPTANVDPRPESGGEGSKIQTSMGSKDELNEGLRSVTPEGFAYAFFMANNDADYSVHEEMAQDYIKGADLKGSPLEDQVRMGWMLGSQEGISDGSNKNTDTHTLGDIGDLPIEVQAAIEDGRKETDLGEDAWKLASASMTAEEQAQMEETLHGEPDGSLKPEKVVLIACCKEKGGKEMPVSEMYKSPLFKARLEYARSLNPDRILVMSAQYGVMELDQVIKPYDVTLKDRGAAGRREWSKDAAKAMLAKVTPKGSEFIFLTGKAYRDDVVKILGRKHGVKITVPYEGLGIGAQLMELNRRNAETRAAVEKKQPSKERKENRSNAASATRKVLDDSWSQSAETSEIELTSKFDGKTYKQKVGKWVEQFDKRIMALNELRGCLK